MHVLRASVLGLIKFINLIDSILQRVGLDRFFYSVYFYLTGFRSEKQVKPCVEDLSSYFTPRSDKMSPEHKRYRREDAGDKDSV